ncbi:MAG TPA: hypothetical protein VFE27_24205 [Acidobacteriaceae bacterium]|jgi:hypothetical protein|nr:hypothetical protein [Acidobacteriaceae bacterium]
MTIARNPKKKSDVKADRKASKFIAGSTNGAGRDLVPVLINLDRAFLKRVDAAAVVRGLSRTGFVTSVLGDRLASEGQ